MTERVTRFAGRSLALDAAGLARPLASLIALLLLSFGIHSVAGANPASQLAGDPEAVPVTAQPAVAGFVHLIETRTSPLPGVRIDWAAVRSFYSTRDYAPVWRGDVEPLPAAREAIGVLSSADHDGLYPGEYHVPEIELCLDMSDNAALDSLEVMLTDAMLKFIKDIRYGRLRPQAIDANWHIQQPDAEPLPLLNAALASDSLHSLGDYLSPRHAGYQRLKQVLQAYRLLASTGGWPNVAAGPKLELGAYDQRVQTLRHRLMLTGDVDDFNYIEAFSFDAGLEAAVRSFQARHGLDVDGVVGRHTLAALNVPVEVRIQQIQLNLERWRWLPDDLGDSYLLVNMAGFELQLVEDNATVMDMRVIIGKPFRSTPAFTGMLSYLVFNPYWNVPYKLAVEDILPKLQEDPEYLGRKGFRVFADWSETAAEIDPATIDWSQYNKSNFTYRLRQDPGNQNSLGRIKFMLPNPYAVYLHDTPARHLFQRPVRTFSSGCIRVEAPVPLAAYLLQGKANWSEEQVLRAIDSRKNRIVTLPRKIPVYLVYVTAWVDDQGMTHFRDDVYGRDMLVRQAWLAETG